MKDRPAIPVLVAAALACAAGALADIITLKNGSRLEGVIERKEPGPKCKPCRGAGEVACGVCAGAGRRAACGACGGTGRAKCVACKGRGAGPGRYVLRLRGGARITIAEEDILSVQESEIPPEDLLPPRPSYVARAAKLGGDDAPGHLALARWALERGLLMEASRHARRAAGLDAALEPEARAVFEAADSRREAAAAADLEAALEHVREGRIAEGLEALAEARRAHAGNPLLSDPERERRFIEDRAADLAARHGRTLAEVARSLERRVTLACDTCSGRGASACGKCAGTGAGECARCVGKGETWCMECNGTKWRVCIRCGGTGKPAGAQLGVSAGCPGCRGRGVVKCEHCRKGRVSCAACGGKGKAARGCRACAGGGKIPCAACLGTGLRRAALFAWGPVREMEPGPVIEPAGGEAARRIPLWQGIRRGCIVTAVRSEDVYEGALTEQLAAVTGARRALLLVCVDNRDGRDQVAFAPGRQGLRLVTAEARQVEAEAPPDVEKLAAAHPAFRAPLAELRATAVLAGVTANVIGAFPEGTDLAAAEALYWGRDEPLRLSRYYVSEQTLAAILKTLR